MDKSEFRILLAEDEPMVREVISKVLTEEGYPVVEAEDGRSATNLMGLEDIHLVITDLRMPGADGMEVLRSSMRINPKVPVILLTAYGTLDTALEAMKEGAFDYLVKPFVMQQLLLVVRNAFTMTNLMREHEKLTERLKEMHRRIEEAKTGGGDGQEEGYDATNLIERLQKLHVIDKEEAEFLKERVKSGNEDVRKYTSLVRGLGNHRL